MSKFFSYYLCLSHCQLDEARQLEEHLLIKAKRVSFKGGRVTLRRVSLRSFWHRADRSKEVVYRRWCQNMSHTIFFAYLVCTFVCRVILNCWFGVKSPPREPKNPVQDKHLFSLDLHYQSSTPSAPAANSSPKQNHDLPSCSVVCFIVIARRWWLGSHFWAP